MTARFSFSLPRAAPPARTVSPGPTRAPRFVKLAAKLADKEKTATPTTSRRTTREQTASLGDTPV